MKAEARERSASSKTRRTLLQSSSVSRVGSRRVAGSASARSENRRDGSVAKPQSGIKLRTNVGEEIGQVVPLVSRSIERHCQHDACVAAATVLRRREDCTETDRAQPPRSVTQRSFVTLERRDERIAVVESRSSGSAVAHTFRARSRASALRTRRTRDAQPKARRSAAGLAARKSRAGFRAGAPLQN